MRKRKKARLQCKRTTPMQQCQEVNQLLLQLDLGKYNIEKKNSSPSYMSTFLKLNSFSTLLILGWDVIKNIVLSEISNTFRNLFLVQILHKCQSTKNQMKV